MGLESGWSFDLTTTDERGEPWDFSKVERRNKAYRMIAENKPWLIIGSPPCTDLCQLQNLNFRNMDPEVVRKRVEAAQAH
eukprot:3226364-Karenia_brevis.AAC.1